MEIPDGAVQPAIGEGNERHRRYFPAIFIVSLDPPAVRRFRRNVMRRPSSVIWLTAVALLAACTLDAAKPPRVTIVAPKNGSTVEGTSVLVRFKAEGLAIVPASGVKEDGKAHHHLFVDADVTPSADVIPKTAQIYHLGNGADTLRIEKLAPGTHRLISVMASGTHVAVAGARQDTVVITVAP